MKGLYRRRRHDDAIITLTRAMRALEEASRDATDKQDQTTEDREAVAAERRTCADEVNELIGRLHQEQVRTEQAPRSFVLEPGAIVKLCTAFSQSSTPGRNTAFGTDPSAQVYVQRIAVAMAKILVPLILKHFARNR
jgi:hypothetical protein